MLSDYIQRDTWLITVFSLADINPRENSLCSTQVDLEDDVAEIRQLHQAGCLSLLQHTCCYVEQGGCRGGSAHDEAEASQSASLARIRASPPSPTGDAQLSSSSRGFLVS